MSVTVNGIHNLCKGSKTLPLMLSSASPGQILTSLCQLLITLKVLLMLPQKTLSGPSWVSFKPFTLLPYLFLNHTMLASVWVCFPFFTFVSKFCLKLILKHHPFLSHRTHNPITISYATISYFRDSLKTFTWNHVLKNSTTPTV